VRKMKKKNVLLYGAGAVGLGIGTCLMNQGIYPDIFASPATCEAIQNNGIKRSGIFGTYYFNKQNLNVSADLTVFQNIPYDYILIATKSNNLKDAAKKLFETFGKNKKTIFVLFQNGWENTEILAKYFDLENIYNARVITGFYRPSRYEVRITVHSDDIKIGNILTKDVSRIQNLCEIIKKGGIPCSVSKDIVKDIWAKLLYNCALNPLGAIFKVKYGDLAQNLETKSIMNDIIEEIFSVMRAAGYYTYWELPKEYTEEFYEKIVPPTYEHKSSMLQDINMSKKTEINFLNGAVVRLGQKYSINTPVNKTIVDMIKFIEKTNDRR